MLDRYEEKIPKTERKSIMNFRAILSNFLDKIQNQGEVKVDVEEAKIWWKKADGLKMKGFYVDRVNETWHNPKSLTEEQYKEVQKYTLPIITNSDKIKELLEKSNSK